MLLVISIGRKAKNNFANLVKATKLFITKTSNARNQPNFPMVCPK